MVKFSKADPSRNKSATQWLIKSFLNNGFLLEDIVGEKDSKVYETLSMFGLHRGKLDVFKRDLNRYATIAEVWKSIEACIEQEEELNTLSGKGARRLEREQAYRESEILIDEPNGFKVVIPKTEFASCWWGRGTRWCTASKKNSYFFGYAEKAPLFIFIVPSHDPEEKTRKFQLYVTENEFQFMNEADETLSHHEIKEYWEYIRPFYRHALRVNSSIIQDNYDHNENNFSFLDDDCLELAISKQGNLLSCFPYRLSTHLYELGVEQNGMALEYVPEELRTHTVCLKAVTQNGDSLAFVPQALKKSLYKFFPKKYKNDDFIEECLKIQPRLISDIPTNSERWKIAISYDKSVFMEMPEHLKTEELCRLAMQDIYTIEAIPTSIIPKNEVIENVLRLQRELKPEKRSSVLLCIGREYLTKEICRNFVEIYPDDYTWVPRDLLDTNLALIALEQSNDCQYILQHIPLGHLNANMVDLVFKKDPKSARHIPFEFHTSEITEYLEKMESTKKSENLVAKELEEEPRGLILKDWQESILQNTKTYR